MSDPTSWLEENGLGQLAGLFAEHDIDLNVLSELTDADLRELGLSLGLRKKILKAIASGLPGAVATSSRTVPHEAISSTAPAPEAERRQLTVMFCDLVDSTRLSTLFDPEEMSELLRAYRGCCIQAVARFGGQIAAFMGDGILIYFGYPHAHEDDAERAVRAALMIVHAVPKLKSQAGALLHVRVGIATGLVVVGELLNTDISLEHSVVGETPNLAARLQALAPTDGIIVAARTYRLTEGLFECVDLGEQILKGFDAPVRAWRIEREVRAESRFDARRGGRMAPIVGRGQEIGLLLDRWQRTRDGEGQVVLISGEPGVGKSRLTRALRAEISGERHVSLSYYCSAYHQTTALHPIIAEFERTANIGLDDTPEQKLVKLEQLLGQWRAPLAETVPLFASLLSISTLDRYKPLALPPAEVIERTLQVMLSRLEELAADRPVICLIEDVHWIDPTLQELVKRIVAPVRRLPILVILTARPEYDRSVLGEAGDITRLSLNRLTRRQAIAMVEQCAGGQEVPPAVFEQIVSKADGVPLFIEELTKTVLESRVLTAGIVGTAASRWPLMLDVPATLHDSLMARLDQMSTVKQMAQLAAVIGRTFTLELLAAVAPLPAPQLGEALEKLVAAEVLYRADRPPQVVYEFKHALLQDVAYQSLLKSSRQQYHLRFARVLEERFPMTVQAQPELVAHHYTEAGQAAAAINYWLVAGKRATQRSANLEAIAQLRRGLALLDALPDTAERLRQEHQLRLTMIAPLIAAKGYASAELEETCNHVVRLSEEIGDISAIFPVLSSRNAFESVTGQIDRARRHAEEVMRLARRYPQSDGDAFAGRMLGSVTLLNGDSTSGRVLLEETLAKYDADRHRSSAFEYGHDHFVTCASYLCLALWHQGDITRAAEYQQQAIAYARSLAHMNTLCLALAFTGGYFHGLCRDGEAVAPVAAEILALASEHALPLWSAAGTVLMGHALAEQGREHDGIAQMQAGLTGLQAIRISIYRPMFLAWQAAAQLRCGRIGEAMAAIDEAFAVGKGGEHWMDAELHRLRGELILAASAGSPEQAEDSLRAALGIARAQRSKTLELRVAMSLARLYGTNAAGAAGQEVLAPILEWFGEGPGIRDVTEARLLLQSLR